VRVPLLAGNWKMHKTVAEAVEVVTALKPLVAGVAGAEVALCPPFTALAAVADACRGSAIAWGAQDVYWEAKGAYTGEIAPGMLKDLGCTYVIVGHSERRGRFGVPDPNMTPNLMKVFGDNDETVARKAQAVFAADMVPIICVGETLAERERGDTDAVISGQVEAALAGIAGEQVARLVFAYEPVWAIGTGKHCDAAEANRVIGLIRATARGRVGDAADALRVQYGGSVKPDNIAGFMAEPEIDGGLVGGASLEAQGFAELVRNAAQAAARRGSGR
jgi:triosephosphate isomerase